MIQETYPTPRCRRDHCRPILLLILFLLTLPAVGQETAENTLAAGAPPPGAEAFAGLEEMTPQQQAAMQAYRSIEMENLINQLFKLEGRISSMEQGEQVNRKSIERMSTLDSVRQAADLSVLRSAYQHNMDDATGLLASIDSLRGLYDWQEFVGDARQLADPTTYENFSTELAALQEEQKNSLRLPDLKLLANPYFGSIYTLSSALGIKDEPEERARIRRLATILDFSMQAERQLEYITTEVAFAEQTGDALYARALDLRNHLFNLVDLEPGKLDDARRKFFQFQFSPEFVREHRDKIAEYQRETDRLREEYGYYRFMLANALHKAAFGLDRVRARGDQEGESELSESLEARKTELRERIGEAATTVARHRGGNG